jgi:hypothetical protein
VHPLAVVHEQELMAAGVAGNSQAEHGTGTIDTHTGSSLDSNDSSSSSSSSSKPQHLILGFLCLPEFLTIQIEWYIKFNRQSPALWPDHATGRAAPLAVYGLGPRHTPAGAGLEDMQLPFKKVNNVSHPGGTSFQGSAVLVFKIQWHLVFHDRVGVTTGALPHLLPAGDALQLVTRPDTEDGADSKVGVNNAAAVQGVKGHAEALSTQVDRLRDLLRACILAHVL